MDSSTEATSYAWSTMSDLITDLPIDNITRYNTSDQSYQCHPATMNHIFSYILMILYTFVCIIGLFGNSLVIYVVLRFSKMKTVTNLYILNLAFADEIFLIGLPVLIFTMHIGEWMFGVFFCKLYMISTSITQFTSSIFLVIMSADRFIAVCHPINSPRFRTPLVSKVVSVIAWCISVILMLPLIIYSTTIARPDGGKTCNIMWPSMEAAMMGTNASLENAGFMAGADATTFTQYTFTIGFAIPLCLILIFYYLVLKKLRTVGPKTKSKEKKRSHRKVTKLVLTVIAVYVLCWTPYWVSQMALINSNPEKCQSKLEVTLFILVGCLGYSNSAMNPILYAFLSDNFKKSFMKAFTCAKPNEINAQLHGENSFFPRFGRGGRNSECFSKAPTTHITSHNHITSKLTNSTKFGNTVESILDATTNNGHENGHHPKNGHHNNKIDGALLNIPSPQHNHETASVNDDSCYEYEDDDDEHELKEHITENEQTSAMLLKRSTSKPPVLHTDL